MEVKLQYKKQELLFSRALLSDSALHMSRLRKERNTPEDSLYLNCSCQARAEKKRCHYQSSHARHRLLWETGHPQTPPCLMHIPLFMYVL